MNQPQVFRGLLSIAIMAVPIAFAQQVVAEQPACSTETVNGNCTIIVDRNYPVTLPTIQMRPGKRVTVEIINPFPFETISLDPQSAQGLVGTDQLGTFVTTATPNLKAIVAVTEQRTSRGGFSLLQSPINPADPDNLKKVKQDLKDLATTLKTAQGNLDAQSVRLKEFSAHAALVYLQIQEIVSPVPRPVAPGTKNSLRDPRLAGTESPWNNYDQWRLLLLCELAETCDGLTSTPPFKGLLPEANKLLLLLAPTAAGASSKPIPGVTDPFFDSGAFTDKAIETAKDIAQLPSNEQGEYRDKLKALVDSEMELTADLSVYSTATSAIAKDLQSYFINIKQAEGTISRRATLSLGQIYDPRSLKNGSPSVTKLLGRQVVFAVNVVNNVATSTTVVATTQKKAVCSITVLYADPMFEVSAGVFFSTLPNRSFSNQTLVTHNPDGSPVLGNVVIAQSISRPTVEPFVAGNWRLGHDFTWLGQRRGAFYFTAALGINTNNGTTADLGVGPSISWRSVMLSGLYHLGHDTRLTQGEFVGQVWCNATAADGSIPKCSGSPPSPSTERYWTSAFAIGISVRIPSVFK
jgi:hypothetical protein